MWKDYSISYIKKNKAPTISIMVAVFIASLFISMICCLFYNMFVDETKRVIDAEGAWQARFTTQISDTDVQSIENYANVKEVIVSDDGVDVYFKDISTIYIDMPKIAKMLDIDESKIEYHNTLLSRWFVFSKEEKQGPPLLWLFYVFIVILVCISLVMIIKSAFQYSMNSRIHQLGILQSIGATPKQVRMVLLQEALILSCIPIFLGVIAGIGLCLCFLKYANTITAQLGLSKAVFEYHYLLLVITIGCCFITVFLSAWFPARRLSKINPLQAIRGKYEEPPKKMRRFRLISAVFGVEGELSRKAFYARRKAFRTSTICLTISFLVLTIFLNFMTLSELSTRHTYFERYKDTWDLMIEIKDPGMKSTDLLNKLSSIDGIDSITAYQKTTAYTTISEDSMSSEVKAIGGYGALNSSSIKLKTGVYLIEVPTVILDNESYEKYSSSVVIGEKEEQPYSILINRIWDSKNSSFKSRKYIPFLNSNAIQSLKLYSDTQAVNELMQITAAAYAEKAPKLREEYKDYTLVQIIPQSTYEQLWQKPTDSDQRTYINICAVEHGSIENIKNQCKMAIGNQYDYTIESRPEKEKANAEIYDGYNKIMSAMCGLLACIGIANVFANTLGYVYQRKREFARYQSIGLTPRGITKILCVEAFIVGVKPVLISIPFNILFVVFAVNVSVINMSEFTAKMPIVPTLCFALIILASVSLSYIIGIRQMKGYNITDALKDDTLY